LNYIVEERIGWTSQRVKRMSIDERVKGFVAEKQKSRYFRKNRKREARWQFYEKVLGILLILQSEE
jgi:hypothetical protein